MTTEDILAMLHDGDSIEDIGNHFATMMNAAMARYDQEQKANKTLKLNRLTRIIADLLDWINEYVTPVPENEDPETLAKDLIKTLDTAGNITNKLFDSVDFDTFKKYLDNTNKYQKKEVKAANSRQQDLDLQDIVDMFLGQ